ncbi:hypothetical protein LCGC14_0668510 [marine sediment metagenome]|uniref:Phage tail tape measure protein domain-containing protein n=1 Tax=marine sediment metagenome TaxID=412755 RepID=A0A0F9QWR0_9ZZZZ
MAKSRTTLKQRIALDGGKDIEEELAKIGKVGEKAFALLKKSAKEFEGPGKRLSAAVNRLKNRMLLLRAAGKRVGDSFRNMARRGRALRQGLVRIGRNLALVGAAGLAAAAALFKLAKSGAAAADAAGKTAQGVGLTVTELGRLVFAAEQSGISQEKFLNILTRFNQGLGELAEEERKAGKATKKTGDLTDRAREAYDQFGVTVRDMSKELAGTAKGLIDVDATGTLAARALKGAGITALDATGNMKPLVGQILEFANAFAGVPAGVEKVKSLIDITGTRNARLAAPFFNQTAAGIRNLGDEAERLGVVFSERDFKSGRDTIDALNRAVVSLVGSGVLKGLTDEIGLIFNEDLSRAADAFTAALRRNRDAIVAFSEGKIRQAISLVEDLVAAIQFRDVDVSESGAFILEARDAVIAFAQDVKAAFDDVIVPAFEALVEAADFVAGALNDVFGTDLTGRQLLIAAVVAQLLGIFTALASVVGLVAAGFVAFAAVGSLVVNAIGVIAAAAGVLSAALLAIGAIPALIVAGLAAAVVAIVVFWDDITAAAQAAWTFITGLWGDLADVLGGFADAAAERLVAAFRGAVATIKSLLSSLISLARRAFKAAREALGLSGGGSASGAGVPVLAGGGAVRGPGTPTSDSILARLSDKEFVIQARAVRHYGANLFAALNSMRLPKFSGGGLAEGIARSLTLPLMPIPVFAAGGPVNVPALAPAGKAGTPFTIVLDGQSFPARADQEVAEALGRVALSQARASAGRPPRRL